MVAWGDSVRFKAMGTFIALMVLAGCESGPTGPTAEDFNNERKALMASLENKKKPPEKVAAVQHAGAPVEPDFGGIGGSFTYDAAGHRDPFRSVEWEEKGRKALLGADRSPLEQYDVNQMSLLAVIWNTGSARALVQDPSGKSYIIGTGTRVGRNEGRITAINDNLVVVKETYVDFLGQETTKDIELRIRLSEGG
jgi:Tfp pilus assembly protein PilP